MKAKYKRYLDTVREDTVNINLLLTMQCQFSCDRCFYFSSPQMARGYMSDEVLMGVREQAQWLHDHDVGVTINLIGGEPTLNWTEFERVFERVVRWYDDGIIYSIEMTTNGWWLKSVRHTRKFFEIVARHTPGFGMDDGFSVRISSSQYHDPFRPRFLQGEGALKRRLSAVWEYEEEFKIFYEEEEVCATCGEPPWDWETDECTDPECDGTQSEYEETWSWPWQPIPQPDSIHGGWIYVDEQRDRMATIMTGKAARLGFGEDRSEHCRNNVLTYKPDGVLNDVCCRGSDLPIGTVFDKPIKLLYLASRFFKEARPTCAGCAEDAREWMEGRGIEAPETTVDLMEMR